MNVQVGQVWEDADSRRSGRTFKIANIDDGMATCENLTGIGGAQPTKPTAFIKLERFKPKYYKLKNGNANADLADDLAKAIKYESDKDPNFISRAADPLFSKVEVVRRKPKAALVQDCKNFWPGEWREVGPYVMLCSENNDFEVSIRQLEEFHKPFEIRVKLYQFTIFSGTIRGDVRDALVKVQDFFLVLNHELKNFIVGDSSR